MAACLNCGSSLSDTAAVCPRCSTPTPWADTRMVDLDGPTQTTPQAKAASHRTTSSTGWTSTTTDIDHGRFAPGTILDERYRIIGRLGKGGMGEVYRADDLRLGQPVALKFLPESVDRDPARLTQLHTEVRMARQV
ncbi:MAG TPA: hypothetical protein VNR90_06025, partial [Vicinamibacterales bacterium]|nr:hypothetical protein [Vicinamibacterales bacterium]